MTARTAPELSDPWIERMLAERAGERAPVGLDAEIAAAVRATPRRGPMFGGALSWRPATARGRALAFGVITAVVVIALVGAAVGAGAIRTRTSPSVLPTEYPAATLLPSDNPNPAPPGVAIDFSHEKWIIPHRITDQVGWMATPTTIFRSTDGGSTWVDTRPPFRGLFQSPASIDDRTAYLVAQNASTLEIAATHDGGATWTSARLDLGSGWIAPLLDFRSATTGTVTVFTDEIRPEGTPVRVWQTSDGGATWQGPADGAIPWPAGKIAGSGPGLLWLNNGKADNAPFDETLWLSRDGGATWEKGRFPASKIAGPGALQWVDSAPFVGDDGRLVLVFDGGDGAGIFRSNDGGVTWRMLGTAPTGSSVGPPQSDSVWVFADDAGQVFTSTIDGGLHWRTVKGTSRIFSLESSFSSPDLGWAAHVCSRTPNRFVNHGPDPLCDGNTLSSIFLTTSDGGRTWQPAGS